MCEEAPLTVSLRMVLCGGPRTGKSRLGFSGLECGGFMEQLRGGKGLWVFSRQIAAQYRRHDPRMQVGEYNKHVNPCMKVGKYYTP